MKVRVNQIRVDMKPVSTILKRLGVTPDGDVQAHVTKIVSHRITRYMPYRSGALATKLKIIKSPTEIEVLGPYAHYQYKGVVWVDPVTHAAGFLTANGWRSRKDVAKVPTSRPLDYDHSKNPEAGPHWDRRLMAAEGVAIAADAQDYIDKRRHP